MRTNPTSWNDDDRPFPTTKTFTALGVDLDDLPLDMYLEAVEP